MTYKEWTFIDNKSDWGPGPWQHEPDKIQWQDAATGLPCLAVRSPVTGAWCGYVGLTPGHPYYGRHYSTLAATLDVHGGLTFSDLCAADHPPEGVCHVPEEGEEAHVCWMGFDCAHCFDVVPALRARLARIGLRDTPLPGQTYKVLAYVREECRHLAAQLAAVPA